MPEPLMKRIWFDADYIYCETLDGKTLRQSLLWYPALQRANDEQRAAFTMSCDGIHWRLLGTDISFESFEYDDAEPSSLQRFFLTHRELNVAEFARMVGIDPVQLRHYINGMKKPTKEWEEIILRHIHSMGHAYTKVAF